jgi:hypothetical protein
LIDIYFISDPKGEKAAAAAKVAEQKKAKAKKAGGPDLDSLLDAGLKKGKK